jgi:hypothetical protein
MGTGDENLDSISAVLVTAGIGQITNSSLDWMIYQGFMEDGAPNADRCICLIETPGETPLEAWAIVYPSLQVSVRGTVDDYTAARQKAQDIFTCLHGGEVALGAAFVFFYAKQSAPISMGRDEKRRPKMAWNFRSMRNTPGT